MTSTAPDTHLLAARYVAKNGGGTPADRRDLLHALGLIGPDGRLVPTPDRDRQAGMDELTGPMASLARVERDAGHYQDDRKRPADLSHVPAGLRNYTPTGEAPAPRRRGRTVPAVA